MAIEKIITPILLLTLIFVASTLSRESSEIETDNNKPWDVMIFSLNWPVSVCDKWQHRRHGKCAEFEKDVWTIHGLWPTKKNTHGPTYCEAIQDFSKEKIRYLYEILKFYWTPIQERGNEYSFWKHEWEKHGTCASDILRMSEEDMYFGQGIEWAKAYNMFVILKDAEITPGNSYELWQIQKAIKGQLQVNPVIVCNYDKVTKRVELIEIRLCFDRNLDLISCDGVYYTKYGDGYSNCRWNKPIYYPTQ